MMAEPSPTTANLEAALSYAARGWRVIPIPPRLKFPQGFPAWQREGTTDRERIVHWWTNAPEHGIGIVTGEASRLFVLDVDVAEGKAGDETLRDLEAAYGPLPETYEVVTGSGGRHLYFAWPASGQRITNSAGSKLGAGLDVRGEGGFVVAPPSLHPSGAAYEVEASTAELALAEAPAWLLAMLEVVEPAPRPASPGSGDRPGDLWASSTSWADVLTPDGWTLAHVDSAGVEHWTRPGKDVREGTSATVNYGGADTLKVFTSSLEGFGLIAEATYTKLGYLAATRYGGDHAAAAQALAALGFRAASGPSLDELVAHAQARHPSGGLPDVPRAGGPVEGAQGSPEAPPAEPGDWAPLDVVSALSGDIDTPSPDVLEVPGGPALFYSGRVNLAFGESGVGKTWLELAAIAEVLSEGGTAMLIDYEDTLPGILSRLLGMGTSPAAIAERFLYVSPSSPWAPPAAAAMATLLASRSVDLVCIDSTGEAMAAAGVKGNDDDEVARWMVTFPKFFSRRGPAVLLVDHVPKDTNAPSLYAIGSQRKMAALDGAAYRVDAVRVPSKTSDGLLRLTAAKDRHGTHTKGEVAAELAITRTAEGRTIVSVIPADPSATPARKSADDHLPKLMERASLVIEAEPGLTKTILETRVTGRAKDVRRAVEALAVDGWIAPMPGVSRGVRYESVTPYRVDDLSGLEVEPESPTRPTVPTRPEPSREVGTPSEIGRRPPSPPLKGTGRPNERRENEISQASPSRAGEPSEDPFDLGLGDEGDA